MNIKEKVKGLFCKSKNAEVTSSDSGKGKPAKSKLVKRLVSGTLAIAMGFSTFAGVGVKPIDASAATLTIDTPSGLQNTWWRRYDVGGRDVFCVNAQNTAQSGSTAVRDNSVIQGDLYDLGLASYFGYPAHSTSDAARWATQQYYWDLNVGVNKIETASEAAQNLYYSLQGKIDKARRVMELEPNYNNTTITFNWKESEGKYYAELRDDSYPDGLGFNSSEGTLGNLPYAALQKAFKGIGTTKASANVFKIWVDADKIDKIPSSVSFNTRAVYPNKGYPEDKPEAYGYRFTNNTQEMGVVYFQPYNEWKVKFNVKEVIKPEFTVKKEFYNANNQKISATVKTVEGNYSLSDLINSGAFKFRILNSDDEYLTSSGTFTSDESKAKTFTLDSSGQFTVNLPKTGTYTVEEIVDGNKTQGKFFSPVTKSFKINTAKLTETLINQENANTSAYTFSMVKKWKLRDGRLLDSTHQDWLGQAITIEELYSGKTAKFTNIGQSTSFVVFVYEQKSDGTEGTRHYLNLEKVKSASGDYYRPAGIKTYDNIKYLTSDSFASSASSATHITVQDIYNLNNDGKLVVKDIWNTYYKSATNKVPIYPRGYFVESMSDETKLEFGLKLQGATISKQYKRVSANNGETATITNYEHYLRGKIKKTDATTGTPVEGAEYALYRASDNQIVERAFTDEKGEIKFDYPMVLTDTFYVKEVAAPSGYKKDDATYTFSGFDSIKSALESSYTSYASIVENIGNASIFQSDSNWEDGYYTKLTTTNGSLSKDGSIMEFPSTGGFELLKVSDNNKPLGFIAFSLSCDSSLTMIEGTKVENGTRLIETTYPKEFIQGSDSNNIGVFQTDMNGKLRVSNLPVGDYKLQEYVNQSIGSSSSNEASLTTSSRIYYFSVEADKITTVSEYGKETIVNSLQRVDLTIEKKDENGTPLENAVFDIKPTKDVVFRGEVLQTAGKSLGTLTTGSDGKAHNLYMAGTIQINEPILYSGVEYELTEIQAPEGYKIAGSSSRTFRASKDAKAGVYYVSHTESFTNTRKTVSVMVDKVLENGNTPEGDMPPFDGATFELRAAEKITAADGSTLYENNALIDTLELKSGKTSMSFTKEVPTGFKYKIVETKAPDGYEAASPIEISIPLDPVDGSDNITVDKQSKILYKATVIEVRKGDAIVNIHKTDDKNNPVKDAEFELYAEEDILNADGTVKYAKNAKIDTVKTDSDGNAQFISIPAMKDYKVRVYEKTVPDGYALTDMNNDGKVDDNDRSQIITIEANKTSEAVSYTANAVNTVQELSVNILKTDKDGNKPLSGAVFELYADEDVTVGTTKYTKDSLIETSEKTDADGKVSFTTKLPANKKYYVKEKTPPAGYAIGADSKHSVSVKTNPTQSSYTELVKAENELQTLELTVTKYGEDNQTLSGAKFKLYANEDVTIGDVVMHKGDMIEESAETGTDGKTTFATKVPAYSSYYVIESQAPAGFHLDKNPHRIFFKDNAVSAPTVSNFKRNMDVYDEEIDIVINIHKTNPQGDNLENAEFTLYPSQDVLKADGTVLYKKDEAIQILFTDSDGNAQTSRKLPKGYTYYLIETAPPMNYAPDTTPIPVKIAADASEDINVTVTNEWQQGKISVLKYRDDNGNQIPLSGAEFTLRCADTITTKDGTTYDAGSVIETVTSDADGIAVFSKEVPVGHTYKVSETKPPENHVGVGSKVFDLTWDATKQYVEVKKAFANEWQQGVITAIKKDSKFDKPLAGAVFELWTGNNTIPMSSSQTIPANSKIQSVTTDKNGKAEFNRVPVGYEYIVKEVEAPKNYNLAENNEQTFVLDYAATVEFTSKDLTFVNDYQDGMITVNKKDKTNNSPIEGAGFTLYANNNVRLADGSILYARGTKIGNEVFTDKNGVAKFTTKVPVGYNYTIKETTVPAGYKDEDLTDTFPLSYDKNVKLVEVVRSYENDIIRVQISKRNASDKSELKGASLEVRDSNNTLIDSWKSDGTNHVISKLPAGSYTLIEKAAPKGFRIATTISFTVKPNGDVTVKNTTVEKPNDIPLVVMEDEVVTVTVSKQDISTAKEIAGARLKVYDKETNEVIDEWTSVADKSHNIVGKLVPDRTYVLEETTAPDGYLKTESIEFTVDENNITHVNNEAVDKVVMKDDFTKLTVNKVDKKTGSPLVGATLQIIDSEGNVRTEWVSSAIAKRFFRIPVGKYILREKSVPDGYIKAADIPFEIKAEDYATPNYVKLLQMEDDRIDVDISKRDINGTDELPDATLTVTQKSGKFIDGKPFTKTWTSSNKPYTLKRVPAGDYALVEKIAPEGYVIATTINFTVGEDGTVTSHDTVVETDKSNPIVVMKDDYTHVTISKKSIVDSSELAGATLVITSKEDKTLDKVTATRNGTDVTPILTIDGNSVSFVSDGTETVLSKLPAGEYTLSEISAPNGYTIAESIDFSIDDHNRITVHGESVDKVVMEDKPTSVTISKTDITNDKELPDATLTLKSNDGKPLDDVTATRDGKPVPLTKKGTSVSFTSGGKPTIITKLPVGKYTLTETSAPDGYIIASSIVFEIDENNNVTVGGNSVAHVKMVDEVNKLTVHKVSSNNKRLAGAVLTLKVDGNVDLGNVIFTAPTGVPSASTSGTAAPYNSTAVPYTLGRTANSITWMTGTTDAVFQRLPDGEYTITELYAPDGYAINTKAITFNVVNGEIMNQKEYEVIVINTKSYVRITKDYKFMISPADTGAQFILTSDVDVDWDGIQLNDIIVVSKDSRKLVFQSVAPAASGEYPMEIIGLPNGNYELVEDFAPDTFIKDENVHKFSVEDGYVVIDGTKYDYGDADIYIPNESSRFYVAKVDENGIAVAGAVLALYNDKGEEIARWTTTSEPKLFEGLPFGKYTVKEIQAPKGFNTAREFTIEHDGSNNGKTYSITNYRGLVMPQTGGAGTTGLILMGCLMLTIGLAYRLRRKLKVNE